MPCWYVTRLAVPDELLRAPYRVGAAAQDVREDAIELRVELIGRHDAGEESQAQRLGRVDPASGQQEIEHGLLAHGVQHGRHRAVGRDPVMDLGIAELRAFFGEAISLQLTSIVAMPNAYRSTRAMTGCGE